MDKEELQHQHHCTAEHRDGEESGTHPGGNDADYQRGSTGNRALGGVDNGRERHDCQCDIGHIVQERLNELVFNRLADECQRQDADGYC